MAEEGQVTEVLQPGMVIAPQIKMETARQLVEKLYGLKVKGMKEINSYDDKNYKVDVEEAFSNPHITKVCEDGYILKVLNRMDSPKQHVDAEHAMCHLLRKHGVMCPIPELNVHGKEKSLERLPIETDTENKEQPTEYSVHLVRLMYFIPGVRLFDVPYTPDILVQSGELLGKLDNILKGFSHPGVDNHTTIWSLSSLPQLKEFLHAVTEEDKRKLVEEIIKAFQEEVEPNYDKYQKGIIHGDFHDHNIIVRQITEMQAGSKDKEFFKNCLIELGGVLDFGDIESSYYIHEIATCMAFFMGSQQSHIDGVDVCGYLLAGYTHFVQLNEIERDALKVLVTCKYVQGLVMNKYTLQNNPENDYIESLTETWDQIQKFWETPKDVLYSKWKDIAAKYS